MKKHNIPSIKKPRAKILAASVILVNTFFLNFTGLFFLANESKFLISAEADKEPERYDNKFIEIAIPKLNQHKTRLKVPVIGTPFGNTLIKYNEKPNADEEIARIALSKAFNCETRI
jgi:hypothetical protein